MVNGEVFKPKDVNGNNVLMLVYNGTTYAPLRELVEAKKQGYEAAVCFVIQMAGMRSFSPNDATHPQFGQALREAYAAGVEVLAVECAVTPESLTMTKAVPLAL